MLTDVADLCVIAENLALNTSALARAPIFVDTTAPLDVSDILTRVCDMKMRHGIELVIIDYLQLCSYRQFAALGRQAESSAMLLALKKLARGLRLPVIVLEQASRAPAAPAGHV